jgi:hypothetical protein
MIALGKAKQETISQKKKSNQLHQDCKREPDTNPVTTQATHCIVPDNAA